ncbi:hypothetical protein Vadar_006367 [Vaccinium darrowii]|uniref:Uncharacterized protein n=1 Tax=Vaccinium darrowii TaxID=229202 RepID=A0ACB7YLR0_9ERIC|nr:hypothetical protein Vadar_006367 [Vaccinium darrowii]
MCKVFPLSLGEVCLRWFDKLEADSITSWKQLSAAFTVRFVMYSKVPKEVDALLALKKGKKEPLRDFAGRYFDTYNEIEGCNEELAVASFKIALPLGNCLKDSLTKQAATSIKELMDRVEKHARIEEDNDRPGGDMEEYSLKDNSQKEFQKGWNGGAKYDGGSMEESNVTILIHFEGKLVEKPQVSYTGERLQHQE